ncbi:hypothetical protein [Devosia sp. A449]
MLVMLKERCPVVPEAANAASLGGCAAIIIAPDDVGRATLLKLGQSVGFGAVADHSQSSHLLPQFLPFFLVHHQLRDSMKLRLIWNIRRSDILMIKFSPIILFMPDGPAHLTIQFIEMGFDDVICLPEKSAVLAARLAGQVGQERLFIEADHYIGPDRRRMELIERDTVRRKHGGSSHDKITIIRHPGKGIEIVSRQHVVVTAAKHGTHEAVEL